jgi:hypothetical protein
MFDLALGVLPVLAERVIDAVQDQVGPVDPPLRFLPRHPPVALDLAGLDPETVLGRERFSLLVDRMPTPGKTWTWSGRRVSAVWKMIIDNGRPVGEGEDAEVIRRRFFDAQQNMAAALRASVEDPMMVFYQCNPQPADWTKNEWSRYPERRTVSSLEFSWCRVDVTRTWLDPTLLSMAAWRLPDYPARTLSDGGFPAHGLFNSIPITYIAVRDVHGADGSWATAPALVAWIVKDSPAAAPC